MTLIPALQLIGPIKRLKKCHKHTEKPDTEGGAEFGSNSSTLTPDSYSDKKGSMSWIRKYCTTESAGIDRRFNYVMGQLHNFVISLYTQWIFMGLKVFHGLFVHYFKMTKGLELISTAELAFHNHLTGATNMKAKQI